MTAKREGTGATYLRVGTTIYKRVLQPLSSGRSIETLLAWNVETLRQDFGKDYLARIPKYDGFCTVPDHTNYRREIHGFLNRYEPIPFHPAEGDFPHIRGFLSHIFGEQVEMGYDYLQLLYLRPLQRLPVLLLVSSERNTGKTTFLNLLKLIFGRNVTFNTNEDFRSQFNDDWAGKLLICVDEVLLNRREDSERIKNLSTARSYKAEAKGRDRKQEYRITLRCNTACNFKLRALARAAAIPRTEVLRQLILNGSVRERLRSEHLEWLAQLKGLARNLNQLTRLAHIQGFAAVAARHATLHAELVRMIEALRRDR